MQPLSRTGIVILCLLSLLPVPRHAAGDVDGNELLKDCALALSMLDGSPLPEQDDWMARSMEIGYCMGFADAFAQANFNVQVLKGRDAALFCLPVLIGIPQTVRIIVGYLRAHPEKLHLPAGVLAAIAFQEAFPCSKKQSK